MLKALIMHQLGWWGIAVPLGLWIAEGIYLGLQDRFGRDIRAGYREYKRQCAFWANEERKDRELKAAMVAEAEAGFRNAGDRTPGPALKWLLPRA